jgi:hypothetical protein
MNSVQQTAAALAMALEGEDDKRLCPWTLYIRKVSPKQWLLTVVHKGVMVLSRRGEFPLKEGDDITLEKEIAATLRYLQRSGYEEGAKISLLTSGFDTALGHIDSLYADIIPLSAQKIDQRISHKGQTFWEWVVSCSNVLFGRASHYREGFWPKDLINQIFAFRFSYITLRILIPFTFFLSSLFLVFQLKAYHLSREAERLKAESLSIEHSMGGSEKFKVASLYDSYKKGSSPNPLAFLRTLGTSLGKDGHLTNFSWKLITDNSTSSRPSFHGTVKLNDALLGEAKKKSKAPPLVTYQQKVESHLRKSHPNLFINWVQTSSKNTYDLDISWQ